MSEAEQTRVVAVLDDLFFASKIKEAAKQANVSVELIKKSDDLIKSIRDLEPKLIIVDLKSKSTDSLKLIEKMKSLPEPIKIPMLGYLPHVEKELKDKAIDVGYDDVIPRSRFAKELTQILKKYS